jgi:hypothetical protein
MPGFVLALLVTKMASGEDFIFLLLTGRTPADDFGNAAMAAQTNIPIIQTAFADTG